MKHHLPKTSLGLALVAAAIASCGGDPSGSTASTGASPRGPWTGPMAEIAAYEQLLRAEDLYSGGKWELFETVGRNTFATAIAHGLDPNDVVVDIGAGSLRTGWWFLHFIDPANYHAIDPDRERLDRVCELLDVDIPRYYNDDFRFPDVEADFVLARSIWTHASKAMIRTMLEEFAEHGSPDAKFLTSVLLAQNEADDYQGEEWVGKGSEGARIVYHSLDWIRATCRELDLQATRGGAHAGHDWLVISRK